MLQISDNLYLYPDTCNVYVIRQGREAVLIDFGSGSVLNELPALGIDTVTAILMTHHHRDQGQGLPLAAEIPLYVPHSEQDLFHSVDHHWQARAILNNYDMRQDRFSLLQSVNITGTLLDYAVYTFSGIEFTIVPTPGHTLGSITLMAEIDGQRVAFTGDLICAPGKVWSLAATQWTYNGAEGVAASIPSLVDVKNRQPDVLLPSHGDPMPEPVMAIDLLVGRLRELLDYRGQNPRMPMFLKQPYEAITPHLLRNRTSMSNAYVILSQSGKALLIDYGYDFMTGMSGGTDRSSRRPWLYTLPLLKQNYGVEKIDVVIPTHFHDDHVAGFNLLRRVEGAQVWTAESFADILERPSNYDLPCLWYDPIPVDRRLPLEQIIQWEEYTFTLYALPGHTLYAVAIAFEVDGVRVLATGDQYEVKDRYNYVYKNRFRTSDYVDSAVLYRQLAPDVILSGHFDPYWVEPGFFECLDERGAALERLHESLLPLDTVDFGAEGIGVWIYPYQSELRIGETVTLDVEILNPFAHTARAVLCLSVPEGWLVEGREQTIELSAHEVNRVKFRVMPCNVLRRARVAVDLTVDGIRFGQQAEALVTVS